MYSVGVLKPGVIEIVELPKPVPGPYDAMVKTEAAFICNATDRKIIDGHFPGINPEDYPLLLGHESVGIVTETGEKVTSFKAGDRAIGGLLLNPPGGVFGSAWGGHSEYIVLRDHRAMVLDGVDDVQYGWDESLQIMKKVPEDIPVEAAALLCTWREVYAGMFSDFNLKKNDNIVVFGSGPVGLSFIKFAKLKGLGKVISIDPLKNKREKAAQMGADETYSPDDPAIKKIKKYDAVIDAVGHQDIINAALPMVRMAGSVCVYGVVGDESVTLHKNRAPYNFNLLFHQWPTRHAEAAAHEPLIEWIRSGKLRYEDFVTGTFQIDNIIDAVEAVNQPASIKTMLKF